MVLLRRARKVRMLERGSFARGLIREVKPSNVWVNERRRYWVIVEFEADPVGQPGALAETRSAAYGSDVERARRWLEQKKQVGVMFDPNRPKRALVIDELIAQK